MSKEVKNFDLLTDGDVSEENLSFDDQMEEQYGTREDWLADKNSDTWGFSDVYVAFLKNDCRGILTYEQAVETYKVHSGQAPENVTECPEIDWVLKKRKELLAEIDPNTPKEEIERLFNWWYPFEPMLQISY